MNIELALARYREEQERKLFLDNCRSTIEDLEQQLRDAKCELEAATEQLRVKGVKLDLLRQEVQEINKALLTLTNHLNRTREELEMEVAVAVRTKVLPILRQLQAEPCFERYRIEFDMLSMHMNHLSMSLTGKSESGCTLSITELRIAALIKNGLSNDQIADQLFLSTETVKTHRRNIRKKLGLNNSGKNLATYLKAHWADPSLTN